MIVTFLNRLQERLEPLKFALLDHSLYRKINNAAALRLFMEHHVFAVWDFMSLLKALQRQLCCVDVPWLPNADSLPCRIVNELVLGEESDADGESRYFSHFDLYHRAMKRCGADTSAIDRLIDELRLGRGISPALQLANTPASACRFVQHTFDVIEGGDVFAIAGSFTFGRESLLPDVFQRIVDELNDQTGGGLDDFRYYLHRHIGLDGNEHGPMANRLVESLCGSDQARWDKVERAAVEALEARCQLWDAVSQRLSLAKASA